MKKVLPYRPFPMQGMIKIKVGVVYQTMHMFPSLPNGPKDPSALNNHRESTSNQVTEWEGFPGFGRLRDTILDVIFDKNLLGIISFKSVEDPFGNKGHSSQSEILQAKPSELFINNALAPFNRMGFPITLTIRPHKVSDGLLD